MARWNLKACVVVAALTALGGAAGAQNSDQPKGGSSSGGQKGGDSKGGDSKGGDRGRSSRGGDSRGGDGRGGFNPEEMRKRMMGFMKERLGAADDEWKEIEPRLTRVMTLQARGAGGRGGTFFGRGPGGPGGPGGPPGGGPGGPGGPPGGSEGGRPPEGERTEASKRAEELRDLIEKDASAEQINKAMEALRSARKKQEKELEQARKDLRELLTLKQEATLVTMGLLD